MHKLKETAVDQRDIDQSVAYQALVGNIYECLLTKNPVQSFLTVLAEYFMAEMVALVLLSTNDRNNGKILVVSRRSLGNIRYYYNQEIPLSTVTSPCLGGVTVGTPPKAARSGAQCQIYNLFLKSVGYYDVNAVDIIVPGDLHAVIKISRGLTRNNFCVAERALIASLTAHIAQFFTVYNRLENICLERNLYSDVINKLSYSSFVLNGHGKVIQCNDNAEILINTDAPVSLVADRLLIGDSVMQIRFQRLLMNLLSIRGRDGGPRVDALCVPRGDDYSGLGVVARLVQESACISEHEAPAVIVFLRDSDYYAEPSVDIISSLLGISPTEARVALLLADGLSLTEVGRHLAMAHATVRTHLRSIFTKVGVNRQALLVRLILKSVAQLA